MNVFDIIISLSSGLDLTGLFDNGNWREGRFTSIRALTRYWRRLRRSALLAARSPLLSPLSPYSLLAARSCSEEGGERRQGLCRGRVLGERFGEFKKINLREAREEHVFILTENWTV